MINVSASTSGGVCSSEAPGGQTEERLAAKVKDVSEKEALEFTV